MSQLTFETLLEKPTEICDIQSLINRIRNRVQQKGITPQDSTLALAETQECLFLLSESEIQWERN